MRIKTVFVGGGSYSTLPIVRAALADPRIAAASDMVLVDLDIGRAETVGRLIQKTPEFTRSGNGNISWTSDINRALPGADMVSVCLPVGSRSVCSLSDQASGRCGFHYGDQLSLSGAFRSLTGGPILLDIARKMERHCPKAWLIDFANPVAVYSGLVNNHTRIRALGICAGFANHRWDLTRLMGHDEYRDVYEVVVAGVNHLSFILRGKYSGRDLYASLGHHLRKADWKPPRILSQPQHGTQLALRLLREMYFRFGMIIFSTEADGMVHIFKEEMIKKYYTPQTCLKTGRRRPARKREWTYNEFYSYRERKLDDTFWKQASHNSFWEQASKNDKRFLPNRRFAPNNGDVRVLMLKALTGCGPQRIVASYPNRGAVRGFKERTVLEYSMTIDRIGVKPDPGLELPDCFHGLVSALATHQTMLGDAMAAGDPKLFAQALFAYPVNQNSKASKTLWRELLNIHRHEINPVFQKAKDFF